MNVMTERVESNLAQQIRNTKNRTNTRPTALARICYLTWQGYMSVKVTFDELERIDVQKIRKILDQSPD